MGKHEDDLEKFLKDELKKEAGEIMEEVNSDESLNDISFPEDLDEKMWKKVQEYDEQQEAYERLSDADKEAIRLGRELQALRGGEDDDKEKPTKKKRRKRHWKVYGIVAIVAVLVMMFGMVSIGGTPFFGKLWTQSIGDRKMTQVDTEREDGDKNKVSNNDEEQVYDEIKEELGAEVVRFLPPGFTLQIKDIDTTLKRVCLIFGNNDKIVEYQVVLNYKEQSYGYDVEDEKIKEEFIEIDGNKIDIIQYRLPDGTEENVAQFVYNDAFYVLNASISANDFKNLLKNLYFL